MNSFDSLVNKNLGWVHENKYVFPIVSLILGIYAALARPKLPKFIEKLFNNPIFRLAMISYIIYRGNKDPQLAVMIASAFLITMHMINKRQVKDLEKMGSPKITTNFAAAAAAVAAVAAANSAYAASARGMPTGNPASVQSGQSSPKLGSGQRPGAAPSKIINPGPTTPVISVKATSKPQK